MVMMGLSPSFFLFLLAEVFVAVAEAGLVPLPLAPAIKGTSAVVGGMATALMASMSAVGADLDGTVVMVAGAGADAELEFVVSLALCIFAVVFIFTVLFCARWNSIEGESLLCSFFPTFFFLLYPLSRGEVGASVGCLQ